MTSGKGKMPSLVLVNPNNGAGGGGEEDGMYIAAYKKLPEQSSGTVRFFDKSGDGDYFVAYNADAKLVAKEAYKTIGVIKTCKYEDKGVGKTLDWVTLNRATFESFVRELLLVRQYRVEVFVNESRAKSRIDWVPKYKASPGNLSQFEDVLFESNEMTVNNGVVGIRFGNVDKTKTVGVAFVNMNEFEIYLVEFADSEALTNLESVLVQLAPKEAVFSSGSAQSDETTMLQKILERNRILANPMKTSEFNDKDIAQDMSRLLHFDKGELRTIATITDFEKKVAVSALAGAIRYLELLSGDSHQNQFHVRPFDMGLYVKLDAAACRALHLSLNALEKKSRHDVTLLGTVDKCRTAQGHRLMAQMLRQPLLSKEKLEERLDLVQILVEDVVLRQSLYDDYFRRVPDCQVIARKLIRKKATLQDYYKLYVFVKKMNNMLDELKGNQSEQKHVLESRFIEPLSALHDDLQKFLDLVKETMDLEEAGRGNFIVRPGFDEEVLGGLMKEMQEAEQDMNALTEDVADELNLPARSVTLEYQNTHGHFFRVTIKDEKALRNNKKFETIRTVKGAVGFRNSKLERLSNTHSSVRLKYEHEQRKIVAQVAEIAADYHACFEQLGRLLAELDVFTSFAYVSANSSMPYIRPILLPRGTGRICFEELRHPCIENLPDITFIPNDVEFQKEKQKFLIVTGPNMGGKSTYLRSVGVAALLAHVGCFVPAAQAEVSLVDCILARIGASDNLVKGVSTFMAEMVEAAHIVKSATSDSLVLIDELGRGTSTYDGFGICWAIAKHLAQTVDCYCILATHFHELTVLADEISTVQNFHVTAVAGEEGLTMLYKIEKGPCDRSFGLHVAKSVGFPEKVLNVAKEMCEMLEDFCQEKDTDDSEEAVKRRREDKMAGQKAIKETLDEVKELCRNAKQIDNENVKAELNAKLQTILECVKEKAKESPYLQHLLEQAKRSKKFKSQQQNPRLAGSDKS